MLININSYPVKPVLKDLLRDNTTESNIIFATNAYDELGPEFSETSKITVAKVVNMDLVPRVEKELERQRSRTRSKAEVMTPSWICNKMNNHCDEEWFGYPNVFNTEVEHTWKIIDYNVVFPDDKTWQEYVLSTRIEITCGEAPYIVSRYDTTTGEEIEIDRRIGMLDRKLKVINENVDTEEEWLHWVEKAYQSVYGYEYQGDNLLIARVNLICTLSEYVEDRWQRKCTDEELKQFAEIICWNFWQMDGITGTIPYGKPQAAFEQLSIFGFDDVVGAPAEEDNETPVCLIRDWTKPKDKQVLKYTDLKKGAK